MSQYSSEKNPRVYMEIEIGGKSAGTIIFELFANIVPRTAENFRQLCTGEAGRSKVSGKMLQFQGSAFHRIIDGFMAQGGDFTKGNGTGGESIYGEKFADENFKAKHTEKYLLSSANAGRNTNGSQFFITFEKTKWLDGKHVVFGRVERGQAVVEAMQRVQKDKEDKPKQLVKIKKCGAMKLKETEPEVKPQVTPLVAKPKETPALVELGDKKNPEEESKDDTPAPSKSIEKPDADVKDKLFQKLSSSKDIKKNKNKFKKDLPKSGSSQVKIGLEKSETSD